MPLSVKLEAAILQLGLNPSDVEYHHSPPLGLREYDETTGLYTPDENDAKHIVIMSGQAHKLQTSGRVGLKGSVVDGDTHKIAKAKRGAKKEEEFRRRLLAKEPGAPVKKKSKYKWGKQKLRSRNTFR